MTTVEALQIKDLQEVKLARIAAALEDALTTAYDLEDKLTAQLEDEDNYFNLEDEVNEMEQIIDKLETAGFAFEVALSVSNDTETEVHERTLRILKREAEGIKHLTGLYLGFRREKLAMDRKLALVAILTK